jgi:hypothetical protein
MLNIELYNIQIVSATKPSFVARETKPGKLLRHAECPTCHVQLWGSSAMGEAVVDLRVGTLDFPSLMEPDVHIFVESKLDWVRLPEGARSMARGNNMKMAWPKSSLERLEVCMRKAEEVKSRTSGALKMERKDGGVGESGVVDGTGEGDKTPTAGEFGGEDDEAFEQRFRETEKALQERLERLSLKLRDEEAVNKVEITTNAESDATS